MSAIAPRILQQGGQENKGQTARIQCFVGAITLGDMIKTTLGPKGMDKILEPVNGKNSSLKGVAVTNDGATILENIWIDNPAAQILIDVSKRQDQQCGDGTTGVVVLAAELLRRAEKLIEKKFHPQTIIEGYRLALNAAKKQLNQDFFVHPEGSKEYKENLIKVAVTTLSSKVLAFNKHYFAELAVNAVMKLKQKNNLKLIHIIKKLGGTNEDSYLEDGFILEKKLNIGSSKKLINPKILLANTPMDADKIKIYGARVEANDIQQVSELENVEKEKMKNKVDKIAAYGCNLFINRQLIYDYPEQLLNNAGIASIQHADFDGVEQLAAVLGAEVVSTFNNPDPNVLGTCDSVEEVLLGDKLILKFRGCYNAEACTIVLCGSSEHILEEIERSLHDAIAVVSQTAQDPKIVYGGGCIEISMAEAVDRAARNVEGKEALVMKSFASALRMIPSIILQNGGYDSASIVAKLCTLHSNCTTGGCEYGIDIENGGIASMKKLGIYESFKSKLGQLNAAAEAAEQIIRVDNVIRCAPKQQEQENH